MLISCSVIKSTWIKLNNHVNSLDPNSNIYFEKELNIAYKKINSDKRVLAISKLLACKGVGPYEFCKPVIAVDK